MKDLESSRGKGKKENKKYGKKRKRKNVNKKEHTFHLRSLPLFMQAAYRNVYMTCLMANSGGRG